MISGSSVDAVAPITSPCCWLSLSGPAVGAGGSRPAAQRPIGSRPLLIVSEPRLVVGKKDLGNKITPGAHPGLGEDASQMRLHGVHRDHQTVGDIDGRETLQHESGQLLLTLSQPIGRHQ